MPKIIAREDRKEATIAFRVKQAQKQRLEMVAQKMRLKSPSGILRFCLDRGLEELEKNL